MLLTSLSVRKPVLMSMVILALVIFGIVAFIKLPIDLMPNIEFPYVTVQTVYIGAGPEEIETSVIKPIEEQMSTVNNIKNITSFCSEGMGFILLEFNLGVNADLAAIDVKDKIDAALYKLPRDLQKPVIGKFDINSQPVINLAVTGPQSPLALRYLADKTVKERLVRIGGVASITVSGGHEHEIQVNLNKNKLDGMGLSVQTVAGMIAAQTANIPGGHISGDRKEYTVRIQGQFENLDQIAAIKIPVVSGGRNGQQMAMVPLSSIADVTDTYKEVRETARFNGQNSVGLAIQKRPDANTVAVARNVFNEIDKINKELPAGTFINVAQDRSKFIRDSVNDMYNNIMVGMALTAVMLLLFLGDLRVTLIAALTIPASIIVTFMGIQWAGFTINFMTLMALAISVGTLVTNAIIVLENIARHRGRGMPIDRAAETGTNEVLIAVSASALTNIAVFVPMATMEGITGQFFKALGFTIVIATVASLFLSFTLAPLMAARLMKTRKSGSEGRKNPFQLFLASLNNGYAGIVRAAVDHRWMTIGAMMLLLVITVIGIVPRLGLEFFPQSDQGIINISIELPSGASLKETDRALRTVEQRALKIPECKSVYASLGGSGTETGVNFASLILRLKDKKDRIRTTADVISGLRPMLADIPDAKLVVKESSMFGGGRSEGDISIEITGNSMNEILALADSVQRVARSMPALADISSSWKEAKPEIKFIPDRMKLDEYGMTVGQIGFALRNAMSGYEAAVFRKENDEFTIRVLYAPMDRQSIDAAENISIQTPRGIVPIKALCNVRYEGGAANVTRKNRQRLVTVMANVVSGAAGTQAAQLRKLTDMIPVKPGYRIYYGGQQERMAESFSTLGFTLLLAIILTYMVLAGSIESLVQPVLIMGTIPLGLIGVLWAMFITGTSISMISIMSFIMLVGVVVNNAILIIDYAHQLERQGISRHDAIIESCITKFNAILMMNLAIVTASLPQALAKASIQAPFAITAIGGIVVSTLMTLFLIPSLYLLTKGKKPAGH